MDKKQRTEDLESSDALQGPNSGSYEIQPVLKSRGTIVSLSWEEISYTVKTHHGSNEILKRVSGYANPGELLVIMGSSGSGKTSLLSILSNQIIPHRSVKISGTVKVNGDDIKNYDYPSITRYVMQQDILQATMTAREALWFAAMLKVGSDKNLVKSRVDTMLHDLKLAKVADNLIGNEMIKGLSGGEKKRVNIGVELISEPSILILDEPTSGLDCFTAEVVIKLLKKQAHKGRTIITTVHQPSSTMFEMFDRLILMVNGHFVYQGLARNSRLYFDNLGYVCDEYTNPPDHFMRILSIVDRNNMSDSEKDKLENLLISYKAQEKMIYDETITENLTVLNKSMRHYVPGLFIEMRALMWRSYVNSLRNPLLFFVKLSQALIMGFLIDILFRDLGYGQQQVENRKGILYFTTIQFIMLGSNSNSMTFPLERPLFLKDYKEGLYGTTAFVLSKTIAELPTQIFFTFLYVVIQYFAIDLNIESAKQFFVFLALSILSHWTGCGYGNFAGVISPNVVASTVIGPAVAAPLMMFGGFFSNSGSLSNSFYWIKYISSYTYTFEGFCLNEFRDLPIDKGLDPLGDLGYTGEVWERAGCMLLIELCLTLLIIGILKFVGEKHKNN
ncbi:hypothetical protein SteCoe_12540 [Stentor coeruleus]|uniref:ABC transporter domain-containing protein n=1 Tax=Stentor coeruleus TaxID=5963 RepID=A0A1R2CAN2_9CILI|nr:hypothetical protein SteCoe_12540 [Stentor coeruleus]